MMITIQQDSILIKELDKSDWSKFINLKLKQIQKNL